MCAYRIPRDLPLGLYKKSRSFCPKCQKKVAWYDNIPVFSYVFLGGKCRKCKTPISIRYPLIEIFSALAFVFVAMVYKWSPDSDLETQVNFFFDLYFFWTLVVLTFIDLEFKIIPDRFSLGNWGIAMALAIFNWFKFDAPLTDAIVGGLAGFGVFFAIAFSYEKLKGFEGLGFGDVKMMGWLGCWLGTMGLPVLVLTASLVGLIVGVAIIIKEKGNLKTAIPFGPFLALGAVVVWTLKKLHISVFPVT
jgi:leader peptidase (prepilin peptidase)/N-methyltransferase